MGSKLCLSDVSYVFVTKSFLFDVMFNYSGNTCSHVNGCVFLNFFTFWLFVFCVTLFDTSLLVSTSHSSGCFVIFENLCTSVEVVSSRETHVKVLVFLR